MGSEDRGFPPPASGSGGTLGTMAVSGFEASSPLNLAAFGVMARGVEKMMPGACALGGGVEGRGL
jgi:hypothetical protein